MEFTTNLEDIRDCNVYIVTVPTPIDRHKKPDLTPLLKASESVGKVLKKGDIVFSESTVYPGATGGGLCPLSLEKEVSWALKILIKRTSFWVGLLLPRKEELNPRGIKGGHYQVYQGNFHTGVPFPGVSQTSPGRLGHKGLRLRKLKALIYLPRPVNLPAGNLIL